MVVEDIFFPFFGCPLVLFAFRTILYGGAVLGRAGGGRGARPVGVAADPLERRRWAARGIQGHDAQGGSARWVSSHGSRPELCHAMRL